MLALPEFQSTDMYTIEGADATHPGGLNQLCLPLQFIEDHVQMEDVRLYIKDVLKEYASLQTASEIKPSWNAVCYTGQLVLDQFAFPYRLDKQVVVQAYPWLTSFGQDLCPALAESTFPSERAASFDAEARHAGRKSI